MHYLAFSAPCVGHKDESRAQNTRRVVDIINLIRQVAAAMHPFAVSTAAQWRKGNTNPLSGKYIIFGMRYLSVIGLAYA